jgi:hypothetical protein
LSGDEAAQRVDKTDIEMLHNVQTITEVQHTTVNTMPQAII